MFITGNFRLFIIAHSHDIIASIIVGWMILYLHIITFVILTAKQLKKKECEYIKGLYNSLTF